MSMIHFPDDASILKYTTSSLGALLYNRRRLDSYFGGYLFKIKPKFLLCFPLSLHAIWNIIKAANKASTKAVSPLSTLKYPYTP